MNRSSIVALVLGATLFGCGVGMVAHEVMEPEEAVAQEEWTGQQWEYKVHEFGPAKPAVEQQMLDEHGSAGWEFVMLDNSYFYFKRPMN